MKTKKKAPRKGQSGLAKERTERHLGMPIEDWRLKKRQEWRAVMNAIARFNYGSAYTPTGDDFYELERAAARISDALDADWICW